MHCSLCCIYDHAVFGADVGGAGSGFCHRDDRHFSGGSKQFLLPDDLGLDHCGVHIFVNVAVVFGAVFDPAFVWACGMASL